MKTSGKVVLLAVLVLLLNVDPLFALDPGDSTADCIIQVTVDTIMEWVGNFTTINLTTIDDQTDISAGLETQTIYANCNFEIGALNTTTAQLSSATDTLVTKYKLSSDGDGSSTTGATAGAIAASGSDTWTDYNNFLTTELAITHVDTDGAVVITLEVQATAPSGEVPDAGSYTATQTLTASWTSD